ncbi:hypothetical protein ACLKA7_007158 [Drosophila subpalustris]
MTSKKRKNFLDANDDDGFDDDDSGSDFDDDEDPDQIEVPGGGRDLNTAVTYAQNIRSGVGINTAKQAANSGASSSSISETIISRSNNTIATLRPTIVTHTTKPTTAGGKFTALPTTITTKVIVDKNLNNMPKKLSAAALGTANTTTTNTALATATPRTSSNSGNSGNIGSSIGNAASLSSASAYLSSGAGNYLNSLSTNDLMSLAAYVASKGGNAPNTNVSPTTASSSNNNNNNNNNNINYFAGGVGGGASTSAASAANFNMAASLLAQTHQVNLVMEQFYSMYSRAYDKLETAIVEELMPRLRYTKKGHDRLLQRIVRRLDKLRPFVQSSHGTSYEQIIKDWNCQSNIDNKDEKKINKDTDKMLKKQRSMHKKRMRDLIEEEEKSNSAECQSPIDLSTIRARLSSLLRSIDTSINSSSVDSMRQPQAMSRKDVQFIYQNQTFPAVPISDINVPKAENSSDGSTYNISRRESHKSELDEYEKRMLEVNLMYNRSFYSMMRLKFPSTSKYPFKPKSKHKRIYAPYKANSGEE